MTDVNQKPHFPLSPLTDVEIVTRGSDYQALGVAQSMEAHIVGKIQFHPSTRDYSMGEIYFTTRDATLTKEKLVALLENAGAEIVAVNVCQSALLGVRHYQP